MSALIGALRVSLSADTAQFEAGMRRAQRQTQASASAISKSVGAIKSAMAGLAAGLTIGLFTTAIKNALDYAGSLGELASTLGLTAKDLQTFRYAAQQVGISQEDLQTGIQKLTISMGKAQLGAKAQADAFKAIGISVDSLKSQNTGDVFREIADKLEKVTDRSQRAAVEVALFGKSGAKLDNLLAGVQGGLNALSEAYEKLGIALSEEQIAKADETADKLAALKMVLQANIASAVVDNANAILSLANALVYLVKSAGQAVQGWRIMTAEFNAFLATGAAMRHGQFANPFAAADAAGQAVRTGASTASAWAMIRGGVRGFGKPTGSGVSLPKFLGGGGGGGGKAREDHSAEERLRAEHQFDQDIRRANIDILNAKKDLATNYVDQASIALEIKDQEKAAYQADLDYQVALNKLTKGKEGLSQVQADQLKTAYDVKDSLERQKILQDEAEQRQRDYNELTQHDFDRRRDVLQSQESIATTAAERRKIELQLLELAYEQKKQALQNIIDTSKDFKEIEDARRDLANLGKTYANDRQGVLQNTQGPLEQYFSEVPKNVDEANEAMQRLQVMGIDGAINSIIALTDGFQSFRDTALQAIKQVIAELIRMQLMKLAFSLFGGAAGGAAGAGSLLSGSSTGFVGLDGLGSLPGFASGGSGVFGGVSGTDRNVLSLNGKPFLRVNRGEQFHVVPQGGGMGGTVINFHVNGDVSRATMDQIAARTRGAIATANRRGI